jgi:hypothetical protein
MAASEVPGVVGGPQKGLQRQASPLDGSDILHVSDLGVPRSYACGTFQDGGGAGLVDDLQGLVDALARRTGRPIVLEDRRQRMIVYSEHGDPVDRVRSESILSRRTTPEVIAWFRTFGIADATAPVHTPADAALGLLPRVCVPIRHQDLLLGFLWFVDADGSLGADELAAVDEVHDRFALALYRENLAGELASNRDAESVRNLLTGEPEVQVQVAQEVLATGQFPQGRAIVTLVARPVLRGGPEADELLRVAIEQALVEVRRQLGPRLALHLVRFDHGVLVMVGDAGPPATDIARSLHEALVRACHGLDEVDRIVVGVGSTHASLADTRRSYEDARQAADVAIHLPAVGPIADWSRLGIYRALSHLSAENLEAASIHPGLERLLEDAEATDLVDTLETYLDLAGSAQRCAEALSLHRTSLYHRLSRIEQLCGTDLKDGGERLALHLGLKLARLAGRR